MIDILQSMMKTKVETTISKPFLQRMIYSAEKMKERDVPEILVENFPTFVVFSSKKQPVSYFFNLTPYIKIKGAGVYVKRVC